MKSSEQINELASALAAFQQSVRNPKTTKTVEVRPFGGTPYTYNYTPLNDIIDGIKEELAKHGISYIQSTGGDVQEVTKLYGKETKTAMTTTGATPYVVTRIMHKSGQWIESDMLKCVAGAGAQEIGSAITYARRYQLAAMLGLAVDDDDDASPTTEQPTHISPKPQQQYKPQMATKATGFSEVDLPKGGDLQEALNYIPFKTGLDAGKPMSKLSDGKLKWLMESEKTGAATKAKAKMVLDSRSKGGAVPMPADEDAPEPLAEEPPDEYMGFKN